MENRMNGQYAAGGGVKVEKKAYDTPELTKLGDVAEITQVHAGTSCFDTPFGSQDDVKSCGPGTPTGN